MGLHHLRVVAKKNKKIIIEGVSTNSVEIPSFDLLYLVSIQFRIWRIVMESYISPIQEDLNRYCTASRPFTAFMLDEVKQKHVTKADLFRNAGVSSGYGYKLVYEEKRTRQRDIILRLCLSLSLPADKMQTALFLYGMPLLFPGILRDAIIIDAVMQQVFNIEIINRLLETKGEKKLVGLAEKN